MVLRKLSTYLHLSSWSNVGKPRGFYQMSTSIWKAVHLSFIYPVTSKRRYNKTTNLFENKKINFSQKYWYNLNGYHRRQLFLITTIAESIVRKSMQPINATAGMIPRRDISSYCQLIKPTAVQTTVICLARNSIWSSYGICTNFWY